MTLKIYRRFGGNVMSPHLHHHVLLSKREKSSLISWFNFRPWRERQCVHAISRYVSLPNYIASQFTINYFCWSTDASWLLQFPCYPSRHRRHEVLSIVYFVEINNSIVFMRILCLTFHWTAVINEYWCILFWMDINYELSYRFTIKNFCTLTIDLLVA